MPLQRTHAMTPEQVGILTKWCEENIPCPPAPKFGYYQYFDYQEFKWVQYKK